MAFNSYFNSLPFGGSLENGFPTFPGGGSNLGAPASNYGAQPGPAPFIPYTPVGQSGAQPAAPTQGATGGGNIPNVTSGGGVFGNDPMFVDNGGGDALFSMLSGMGGGNGQTPNYGVGTIGGSGSGNYGWPQSDINAGLGFPNLFGSGSTGTSSGGNIFDSIGNGISGRFDQIGNNISNAYNSATTSPDFTTANGIQTAINAGGLFNPLVGVGAGLLQGFNLLDPGETTGNSIADFVATPGPIQRGVANIANWIDRQFGGTYMPSSYIDPIVMGPNPDGSSYQTPLTPLPPVNLPLPPSVWDLQPGVPQPGIWGTANGAAPGGGQGQTPDPFFAYGGQVADMGGAGIFNMIGLAPYMTGDFGGRYGDGGAGNDLKIADGKIQVPGYGG